MTATALDLSRLPLSQLHPSALNVRKSGGMSIEALAESIAAQGLIHNLTVIQIRGGKSPRYEVAAGGRRLQALKLLAKQKRLPASTEVPCHIVAADEARALSLSENVQREAMHPADEFEAFAELLTQGMDERDVAAQYGVSVETVRRRLALARVSPKVLAAYRAGSLELDQVMALTLTDNHDLQEQIAGLADAAPSDESDDGDEDAEGDYDDGDDESENDDGDREAAPRLNAPSAWRIRQLLANDAVPSSDRRAVFVGEADYLAAGGQIRRDLFSKDDGAYYEDAGLLERLTLAKLETAADELREQWAWVECLPVFEYAERSQFSSAPTVKRADTDAEAAQRAANIERQKRVEARMTELEDAEDYGDEYEALETELGELQEAIETLDAAQEQAHPEAAALSGAVVSIDHRGTLKVTTGLVRAADKAKLKAIAPALTASLGSTTGAAAAPVGDGTDPACLRAPLTAYRTATLQNAIAERPGFALRLLAAQMLGQLLSRWGGCSLLAGLRLTDNREAASGINPDSDNIPAAQAFAERTARFEATHEGRDEDNALAVLDYCLALDDAAVAELLAYCTAAAYDDINRFAKAEEPIGPALLARLQINMAEQFTPTVANYFGRVTKAGVIAALTDAGVASADDAKALEKLKRAELASEAERRIAGTGWLPPSLRRA